MPNRRRGRGRCHRRNKEPGPMSTCILPHDVLVNILSRIPVKYLLRFRCVCKSWRTLFRNPRFITAHLNRTASDLNTCSLLVHSVQQKSSDHILSLLRTDSIDKPINLDHPFPYIYLEMDVVGSCNGIVCLSKPRWGDGIYIWNPATKQSKGIRLSGTKPLPEMNDKVSIGFGFDPHSNDYKVVSILCFKPELKVPVRVEVYSVNAETWRKIEVEQRFNFLQTKCAVIVKGIPYWTATIEDAFGVRGVFVSFDVQNAELQQVPVPIFTGSSDTVLRLVDLKDSLSVIVYPLSKESKRFVDVWMMEDDGGGVECWSKKFTVGPILGMTRMVGCSKNGELVAENAEGKLFLYDSETGEVTNLRIDGARECSLEVFNYTESLVSIKGATSLEKLPHEDATRELMNRTGLHVKVHHGANGAFTLLPWITP